MHETRSAGNDAFSCIKHVHQLAPVPLSVEEPTWDLDAHLPNGDLDVQLANGFMAGSKARLPFVSIIVALKVRNHAGGQEINPTSVCSLRQRARTCAPLAVSFSLRFPIQGCLNQAGVLTPFRHTAGGA